MKKTACDVCGGEIDLSRWHFKSKLLRRTYGFTEKKKVHVCEKCLLKILKKGFLVQDKA